MGDNIAQGMRSVNRRIPANLTPGIVLLVLAAIVLLIIFSTSFIVVDQTERAVITTFGKFTKVAQPGLTFKWPFGIQNAYHVKTEVVQTEQFGFRTDKAGVVTQYSSKDTRRVDNAHGRPQHHQRRVDHPIQDHGPESLAFQRLRQGKDDPRHLAVGCQPSRGRPHHSWRHWARTHGNTGGLRSK